MLSRKTTAVTITLLCVIAFAVLIEWFSPKDTPLQDIQPFIANMEEPATRGQSESTETTAEDAHGKLRDRYFQQVVAMLHAKEYDYAIVALHELLQIAPEMPEAYTNMGYALLGIEDFKAARDFFNTALELNVNQINAYYGLAIAEEKLGNLNIALASMETYVHRSKRDDPYLGKAQEMISSWRRKIAEQRSRVSQPSGQTTLAPSDKTASSDQK